MHEAPAHSCEEQKHRVVLTERRSAVVIIDIELYHSGIQRSAKHLEDAISRPEGVVVQHRARRTHALRWAKVELFSDEYREVLSFRDAAGALVDGAGHSASSYDHCDRKD